MMIAASALSSCLLTDHDHDLRSKAGRHLHPAPVSHVQNATVLLCRIWPFNTTKHWQSPEARICAVGVRAIRLRNAARKAPHPSQA
jgi:hypothetical protein